MRVIEINSGFHGSTGTIMLNIAKQVRSTGGEALTFSQRKKSILPSGHIYFGSQIENFSHRFYSLFSGISGTGSRIGTHDILKKIDSYKPDILHLHNLHGWYINLPMLFEYLKNNKIKTVWTLHDCWGFTAQCSHFTIERCEKWITGCYDCPRYRIYPYTYVDRTKEMWKFKKRWFSGVKEMVLVTPSDWLCGLVKQSFLSEYPVKAINNGIDLSVFKSTTSNFRCNYGLGNKKIILGVASTWNNRKGLDTFIQLSEALAPNYKIVLVGTNKKIDKMLPSNILSIHRTHNINELAEIYTAADVFFNPTREETFGLVNIESIACGTPVVTNRVGGTPETISEKTGVAIDCNNINDSISAINEMISRKVNISDCIKHVQKFDVECKFQDYVDLYKSLLERSSL